MADATTPDEAAAAAVWQQTQRRPAGAEGLRFARRNTRAGVHPFEEVAWEIRDAVIKGTDGKAVFEQRGVEFPRAWSQTATQVVTSKYFRGHLGSETRERSVRQLIGRVAETIARWGRQAGYFASPEDGDAFEAELTWLLLHQRVSFNSPVWFNVGVEEKPQCSACFINSVADSMDSILRLAHTEAMLFKGGSGAGSNLSSIRGSKEMLAGGGQASGPVSFMRGFDAFAGVIKSGGKTRRAAKMVILDADHPDIVEFIRSKAHEEQKAWALIDAGYDGSFNGEAYSSVYFQNANHSVRVTDDFMQAVETDSAWQTRARKDGAVVESHPARALMREISEAAWLCGDPGLQFDTTINRWHTCPETDRIRASNPCSEYMFLDDSACNLASLNLLSFVREDGEFDTEAFRAAVELTLTAQEILVDFASYPTELIGANSHRFRPLGLGYANLGALLMTRGLPYDSEEGRSYAGAITALMHGAAAAQSAKMAGQLGPFPGYDENRDAMLGVMRQHRAAVGEIDPSHVPLELYGAARKVWGEVSQLGQAHGFRNAQLTVLAPTGTIAFMMDCDTTGVEPDIALVKYKKLVGGGTLKIVNRQVARGLQRLGYDAEAIAAIEAFVDEHDTIEGAPGLRSEHEAIFDCAFRAPNGHRSIAPMGHLKMMAAVQPFLSGAISKTVNLPHDATVEDVERSYLAAWKLGLKAVAIYRDGSKRIQPLSTRKDKPVGAGALKAVTPAEPVAATPAPVAPAQPRRRKLPDERAAITHKFSIAGHEGYVTVGLYEDGTPGELFVVMAKEGSTISGLLDAFATSVSMALQYGVPLAVLSEKLSHTRYEPSGFTPNPDIRFAKSVTDYIFRWLALKFLDGGRTTAVVAPAPVVTTSVPATPSASVGGSAQMVDDGYRTSLDAPPCHACGTLMVVNGACHKCPNCGETSGCS
ncbi:MAG: vitamin B12-dependent ribonucleotide reductase [Deltaproteobacteria bacterium]|nr:vitamin B12-dependent ribonucleotide reductase [Deltaproteobacteria bacterium]